MIRWFRFCYFIRSIDKDEDDAWVDTDGGDTCVEGCALVDDDCEGKCLLSVSLCWKQFFLIPFKESILELCLHCLPYESVMFFR